VGVNANSYARRHRGYFGRDLSTTYYDNTGHKRDASAFAKISYGIGRLRWFGDLQLRTASFRYEPDATSGIGERTVDWTFANPKVGVTVSLAPGLSAFASIGQTTREPARADLLAGADDVAPDDVDALFPLTRVRPERVQDYELGGEWQSRSVSVRANAYAMEFRDEIALVGLTTPLGYDVRRNVGRSHRRGVELEASWRPVGPLTLAATAALSRNRISEYRDEATEVSYVDVPTALTPSLIAGQQVSWRASRFLTLTSDGRYQSRQFLDPTGDEARTAGAFFVLDGGALLHLGRHELLVQGRNLLDRFALTAGDISSRGVPRYFILAPRSVEVTARLRF
jgi:iron complex outermembrane receptor protein